jgi:WD40 repeat protein
MIFQNPFQERVIEKINAHAGEITKIILSPDNRFLFSAGTDGTLFIFSVSEQLISNDGALRSG